MNISKKLLHLGLALASLGGVLTGWIFVARTLDIQNFQNISALTNTVQIPDATGVDQYSDDAPSQRDSFGRFANPSRGLAASNSTRLRTGGS